MTQWKLAPLTLIVVATLAVAGQEKKMKIKRADLPPAVQKTHRCKCRSWQARLCRPGMPTIFDTSRYYRRSKSFAL
jgi:hypothetical protein